MKHLLGLMLACVLASGLVGCGGGSSGAATDTGTNTSTNTTTTTGGSGSGTTTDTTTGNTGGNGNTTGNTDTGNTTGNTVSNTPKILIETSLGNITLELDRVAAPQTVANFMAYVEEGFYNGTIFHRVIPGFMVQGGGFNPGLSKKTTKDPIQNEAYNGLKNDRGTIAMARTTAPHSATSQFFINVVDNAGLNYKDQTTSTNWGYAVFGKVTAGMDVVDKIVAVKTASYTVSGVVYKDVPVEAVTMTKVSVIQ